MGENIYQLIERLFPICRSITGEGVRETLSILQAYIPLEIHEVPTGTAVFDWTVPKEWNIREAWIKNPQGEIIVNFQVNNLHLLNYSIPIHRKLSLEELRPHLFSLPDQADLIPYRTSYYQENWGFCLSHRQLLSLEEGEYEVYIDSTLTAGHLTYGELFIEGESKKEILLTAHVCHPSLANDNLSGISVVTHLAKYLLTQENKYSYRILFIPGTIGSITWLAQNEAKVANIQYGLVASLLGDSGGFTYKKSRRGDTRLDQIVAQVLAASGEAYQVIDFFPYGYDERQFCSPAFNLAVGNLTRSQFGQYPEYHTSGDNLDLVQPTYLESSFRIYQQILKQLEQEFTSYKKPIKTQRTIIKNGIYYRNRFPKCEPQLGKRGLYDAIGGDSDRKARQMTMLWLLNLCDGTHSLEDIAHRSKTDVTMIREVAEILEQEELLERVRN